MTLRIVSLLFHDVYQRDPSESGRLGSTADRYKLSVAEFDTQLMGLARAVRERPVLANELRAVERRPAVAITVDDGGISYSTTIAERLEARGWRGHCFVTTGLIGRRGFLGKRQIRELRARGHYVGSHSVSHPAQFGACGWNEMVREWAESRKALEDILGETVVAASVPGGNFSARVARAAREAGFCILFTSEPVTRVRAVEGCLVLGRFIVRHRCRPDFSRRVASLEASIRAGEWLSWNTKKILKRVLGATYPRIAEWWTKSHGSDAPLQAEGTE